MGQRQIVFVHRISLKGVTFARKRDAKLEKRVIFNVRDMEDHNDQ